MTSTHLCVCEGREVILVFLSCCCVNVNIVHAAFQHRCSFGWDEATETSDSILFFSHTCKQNQFTLPQNATQKCQARALVSSIQSRRVACVCSSFYSLSIFVKKKKLISETVSSSEQKRLHFLLGIYLANFEKCFSTSQGFYSFQFIL